MKLAEGQVSPYHLDGSMGFYIRFLKVLGFGMRYRRVLYHKTLISFNGTGIHGNELPESSLWKPENVLSELATLDGKPGGGDVFSFEWDFAFSPQAFPWKSNQGAAIPC